MAGKILFFFPGLPIARFFIGFMPWFWWKHFAICYDNLFFTFCGWIVLHGDVWWCFLMSGGKHDESMDGWTDFGVRDLRHHFKCRIRCGDDNPHVLMDFMDNFCTWKEGAQCEAWCHVFVYHPIFEEMTGDPYHPYPNGCPSGSQTRTMVTKAGFCPLACRLYKGFPSLPCCHCHGVPVG